MASNRVVPWAAGWRRVGVASALAWAAAASAVAAPEGAEVRSLIVRLKDAPGHVQLSGRGNEALRAREDGRWGRLLQSQGLGEARLRAMGKDQRVLELPKALSAGQAAELAQRLQRSGEVDWAEPNTRERRLQFVPNDPLYSGSGGQWWLQPVSGSDGNVKEARLRGVPGYQTAWLRNVGSAAAVVAVLDTGITNHPELSGRVLPGYDFVSEVDYANDGNGRDSDPADPGDWVSKADLTRTAFSGCVEESSSWHGTIISVMAAGITNNGTGVAGINWNGRVLPVRVAGKCGATVSDIVDGMRWAAGLPVAGVADNPNPARILNISFGSANACGSAYQAAIDEIRREKGAVVVAAAGNEWAAATRPANCAGAIGVVALNRDGFKSNYSNFGSALSASGIATVGGDDNDGRWGNYLADGGLVTGSNSGTTVPSVSGYYALYGTSFASPVVSGAISLMLSVNPNLSFDQILAGLKASARPHVQVPLMAACSNANPGRCACTTATCGVGILDADQALAYAEAVMNGGVYTPPARSPAVIDNVDVRAALSAASSDRDANAEPPAEGGGSSGGGGGGAMSLAWVSGVAAAAIALSRRRRPAA